MISRACDVMEFSPLWKFIPKAPGFVGFKGHDSCVGLQTAIARPSSHELYYRLAVSTLYYRLAVSTLYYRLAVSTLYCTRKVFTKLVGWKICPNAALVRARGTWATYFG